MIEPAPLLERHGVSRLPVDETKTKRGRFAETTIGYVHIDRTCELRHADGKIHMFLAIDRVSKFTFVAFYENAGTMNGAAFLRGVVESVPLPDPHGVDRQRHGLRCTAPKTGTVLPKASWPSVSSIPSARRTASPTN